MNKQEILTAIATMREFSKKRNFDQSIDLNINFTGLDFKKPENRIDVDVVLPNSTGKQGASKTLVFVHDRAFGEKLKEKAKVIFEQEITELKPKQVEEFISEYDVLLAEGPSILLVAKHLGQQLAPKGKMPKPIIADVRSFEESLTKASSSVKVTNAKGKFMPVVHIMVGKEKDTDENISQNVSAAYDSVLNSIGGKQQNIKSALLKFTMGPPIKIGLSKDELAKLKQKLADKDKPKAKVQAK